MKSVNIRSCIPKYENEGSKKFENIIRNFLNFSNFSSYFADKYMTCVWTQDITDMFITCLFASEGPFCRAQADKVLKAFTT